MPKYLYRASYSQPEGVQGLLKDGGTARREAIRQLVEGLGGTLEGYYFAFGDDDVFAIVDLPDNATAAAGSLAIGASGVVSVTTVPLMTPEEMDGATQTTVNYRPPGG